MRFTREENIKNDYKDVIVDIINLIENENDANSERLEKLNRDLKNINLINFK